MKRIFTLMMLCASTLLVFAETAYEKKLNEIKLKYISISMNGYNKPLSREDLIGIELYGGVDLLFGISLHNLATKKSPKQFEILSKELEKEIEQAKSLMTEEDRIKEWKKSDYGKMVNVIQTKYLKKFNKDKFETEGQYYDRIKSNARDTFLTLCTSLYEEILNSLTMTIDPIDYDPEDQISTTLIPQHYYKYNFLSS